MTYLLVLLLYILTTAFFVLSLFRLKSPWPKRTMIMMTVTYALLFLSTVSAPLVAYVMMHANPEVPPSPVILWITITYVTLNALCIVASMPISWVLYRKKRIKAALITGFTMLIAVPTVNGILAFLAAWYLVSRIHG